MIKAITTSEIDTMTCIARYDSFQQRQRNGIQRNFHIKFVENLFKERTRFSSLYTNSLLIVPLDAHTTRRISLIGISTLPFEITPFLMVIFSFTHIGVI